MRWAVTQRLMRYGVYKCTSVQVYNDSTCDQAVVDAFVYCMPAPQSRPHFAAIGTALPQHFTAAGRSADEAFATTAPSRSHEHTAMTRHTPPVTYVFPTALHPANPVHPSLRRARRSQPFPPSARPLAANPALPRATRPACTSAGEDPAPPRREQRPDLPLPQPSSPPVWPPLKLWLSQQRRRNVQPDGKRQRDADGASARDVVDLPAQNGDGAFPAHVPALTSSSSSEQIDRDGDGAQQQQQQQRHASKAPFRWPWQQPTPAQPSAQDAASAGASSDKPEASVSGPDGPARSDDAGGMTPDSSSQRRRVQHSDSKPGGTIDPENVPTINRKDVSLQERWKEMVDSFIPKPDGKRGGDYEADGNWGKGSDNEIGGDSEKEGKEGSESPAGEGFDNTTAKESKRKLQKSWKAGITELYHPPADPKEGRGRATPNRPSWFKPPWDRSETAAPAALDEYRPAETKAESDENGVVASEDDTPRSVAAQKVAPNIGPPGKRDDSRKEGWFAPPWKRRRIDGVGKSVSQKVPSIPEKVTIVGTDTSDAPVSTTDDKEDRLPSLGDGKENNGVNENEMGERRIDEKSGINSGEEMKKAAMEWFRWPGSAKAQAQRNPEDNLDDCASLNEGKESSELAPTRPVEYEAEEGEVERESKQESKGELGSQSDSDPGRKSAEKPDGEKLAAEKPTAEKPAAEKELVKARRGVGTSPAVRKPDAVELPTIPQRDIASMRLIFGSETFFATEVMAAPGGILFRGNLRGEAKETLAKLEERLYAKLGDKYTLCLAEGDDRRPVVVVVPSVIHKYPATTRQRLLAFGVLVMTLITCFSRGVTANIVRLRMYSGQGVAPVGGILDKLFYRPMTSSAMMAVAILVSIITSQVVQRFVASRHRTRVTVPFLLPSYHLGSFGAIVQLSSPTPNRAALFDIGLAGVVALVVPALVLLVTGLRLSTIHAGVYPVPMSTVAGSLLMGFLTKQVPNGKILVDYGHSLIGLHPLAIIGANCLSIAAVNLLPIRQLDGGRIMSALYGRRVSLTASRVAVLFLLLASSKNPNLIMFLLGVSFGPWNVDRPAKNELTEPDAVRTIVGYIFMLLMIALLLPYPKSAFFGTL